jgi:CBS domain-containing protein
MLDSDLRTAAQLMVSKDLRSLPVTDAGGAIVGLIDEHDIATAVTA